MTIKDELLALKKDGVLLAHDVVTWAQANPHSLLHKSLEWDDAKAGYEYRLEQVRRLVRIHVVTESGERQLLSLSVDRTNQAGGGYREMQAVLADKTLRDVLLTDALRELDRIQKKYEHLKELSRVWAEKDRVRRRTRQPAIEQRAAAG